MDFLGGVNRLLRAEGALRDDDSLLTSFSGTSFAASSEFAQIAIQTELTSLVAEGFLPYEEKDATLTLVDGTRLYALASDFVRFRDKDPFLLKVDVSGASLNETLRQWPGGEDALRQNVWGYRDETGAPGWFYVSGGTVKQIGLYKVPDSTAAGDTYRYYYESAVSVAIETDDLPFATEQEAETFIRVAGRRYKFIQAAPELRLQLWPAGLKNDGEREDALGVLQSLLRATPPTGYYGRRGYG